MIDGVHFGEHLCVVALGIGIDGTKHPLGLVEGSTENTTVVTDLLTDLRERGLDTTRPILVCIDGGKALHAAVMAVFDHPVIQRCQMHYADLRIMPMWMRNPAKTLAAWILVDLVDLVDLAGLASVAGILTIGVYTLPLV